MDELRQLEEEFSHDDSTSCTSSLATTASVTEDSDELHLGAEANSFDFGFTRREDFPPQSLPPIFSTEDCCSRRGSSQCGLIVMKELYSSQESNDTYKAFSSITNVVDLLRARECDPGEMLACLGFAASSSDHTKREILSRFKPSPFVAEADNKRNEETDIQGNEPHFHESISKAKEWLALHHNEQSANSSGYVDKSQISKMPISDQSALASIKRPVLPRTNKLRRRFSKSRQSSFELLLPKLKEEETSQEGTVDIITVNKAEGVENGPYSAIRESSMERVNSVSQSPSENPVLIKGEDDKTQVDSPLGATNPPQLQAFSDQSDSARLSQDLDRRLKEELQIGTAGPIRPPKNGLLQSHQLESFEMEEINSCNEDFTDCNKRRTGVVAFPDDDFKQPRLVDSNLPGSPASNHGSVDNESSSGFDEEDAGNMGSVSNFDTTVAEDSCQTVEPHTVVQSIEANFRNENTISIQPASTRYVYDVPLGETYLSRGAHQSRPVAATNRNGNNNADSNFPKRSLAQIRSNSFSALPTHYIPLRYEIATQGARKASNTSVVTPVVEEQSACGLECANGGHAEQGKCRRLMSGVRRRRMEFANRSAVSGDSFDELYRSSSLVRRNGGGFSVRKRRPGCFLYYGSTGDLFENRRKSQASISGSKPIPNGNSLPRNAPSPDSNSEVSETFVKPANDDLNDKPTFSLLCTHQASQKLADSPDLRDTASACPNGPESASTNVKIACASDTSQSNVDNGLSQVDDASFNNNKCDIKSVKGERRKKLTGQWPKSSSDSLQSVKSLPTSRTHCGQCFG